MTSLKIGNNTFNPRVVAARDKDKFIEEGKKQYFLTLSDDVATSRLAAIWEQCSAAAAETAPEAIPAQGLTHAVTDNPPPADNPGKDNNKRNSKAQIQEPAI